MPILSKTPVLHWTHHSRAKMRQYRLSDARVKRVLHSPKRIEEGIAEKTLAMMQPANTQHSHEIWVMVAFDKKKGVERKKIISAWRYPGKTKPGSEIALSFLNEMYEEYLDSADEALSTEPIKKSS